MIVCSDLEPDLISSISKKRAAQATTCLVVARFVFGFDSDSDSDFELYSGS